MNQPSHDAVLPHLQPIDSTSIDAIGYDPDSNRLVVRFRDSGDTYVYFLVARTTYSALLAAPSKGAYLNREIKPHHAFEQRDVALKLAT